MILPASHLATLALIILCMFCWGLWANTFKSAGKLRFELYCFDFAIGCFLVAVLAAITLGTLGFDGFSFSDDIRQASKRLDVLAFLAGFVFNLGNMLLIAAMSVVGMSISFFVALGVAITLGASLAWAFQLQGNPAILFTGVAILLAAVAIAIYAYREFRLSLIDELVRTGKLKSTRKQVSIKGVILALFGGLLLGSFIPLVQRSEAGDAGLGPYSAAVVFAAGVLASTFFCNLFFMNLPVSGEPLEIRDYFRTPLRQHLWGAAGGALWCAGLVLSLVSARAEDKAAVSSGVSFALSQGSMLIAVLCGILLWKEFAGSDMRVRALLFVTMALFICGLAMVSVAPAWTRGS